MPKQDKYEKISELAKRRGFFWPSYEIYGGVSGFYTFGPLGVLLKHRIENKFRDFFVRRLGLLEIESSVITPSKVFEASGHVEHFKEPMIECVKCHKRFRADHLLQEEAGMSETETEKLGLEELKKEIEKRDIRCPECNGLLGDIRYFLTMFTTTIGPYSEAVGYGRPEAAQGIFVEFRRLYENAREQMPFGVLQIGHALRNEISPRQGILRLREFTIMDVEFFFDPENPECVLLGEVADEVLPLLLAETRSDGKEDVTKASVKEALEKGYIKAEWQAFFMAMAKRFVMELGVPEDRQRFIEKFAWERAHYSAQSFDQQVLLDRWGWTEVSGHAYRTDYDLKQHMKFSNVDMRVFKKYEKPVVKEKEVVKPIMQKIGQTFKNDAPKIVKLLGSVAPQELRLAFQNNGFYMLESFKILPEHVAFMKENIEETGRRFIPHVVEPSFGSDRLVYVALEFAYKRKEDRTLLSFPRDLSPIQLGVFPLVSRDGLPEKAKEVYRLLLDEGFTVEYDESGSIGRRYARADEIGIPLGITIDYQTLKDNTVTIRDRDSWQQVRSIIEKLPQLLHKYFLSKLNFQDLGQPVLK
ncbi:MAG: glycine--tRNA ligase [Candidatus Bathyarchaeia archaeon]